MTKKDLSQLKEYALSGEDLVRLVGAIEVISYPDLDQYNSIDDLFAKRNQVVILFLTESKEMGHWLGMLFHPKHQLVEIFDSYGLTVDGNRQWLTPAKIRSLDQAAPQINDLLRKSRYKSVYNNTPLQADDGETATCGRHVACRIMHSDMMLEKYIDLIESSGYSPDDWVTLVTYRKLGK